VEKFRGFEGWLGGASWLHTDGQYLKRTSKSRQGSRSDIGNEQSPTHKLFCPNQSLFLLFPATASESIKASSNPFSNSYGMLYKFNPTLKKYHDLSWLWDRNGKTIGNLQGNIFEVKIWKAKIYATVAVVTAVGMRV